MNKSEKQKIKISLGSINENKQQRYHINIPEIFYEYELIQRRLQEHYYCKDGIFYQIPRRDTAEYNEYQHFLKTQVCPNWSLLLCLIRKRENERKLIAEKKSNENSDKRDSIFQLLQFREISNLNHT